MSSDINITHFIDIDKLHDKFDESVVALRNAAVEFWSIFIDQANLKPDNAIKRGYNLAENIKTIFRCF